MRTTEKFVRIFLLLILPLAIYSSLYPVYVFVAIALQLPNLFYVDESFMAMVFYMVYFLPIQLIFILYASFRKIFPLGWFYFYATLTIILVTIFILSFFSLALILPHPPG